MSFLPSAVLAELEACSFRNKSPADVATHMKSLLDKYLPLDSNSSQSPQLFSQRQKDHYSHFILRLAFSSTEDLRRRFARVETMLFRLRFNGDDLSDRNAFISNLDLDWWEVVSEEERREYAADLAAMNSSRKASAEEEAWFKVDWSRVPELVEQRRVFLKGGKAFVPAREQASMVIGEFSTRLEKNLEVRCHQCSLPLPGPAGPTPSLSLKRWLTLMHRNCSSPRELSHGSTKTNV